MIAGTRRYRWHQSGGAMTRKDIALRHGLSWGEILEMRSLLRYWTMALSFVRSIKGDNSWNSPPILTKPRLAGEDFLYGLSPPASKGQCVTIRNTQHFPFVERSLRAEMFPLKLNDRVKSGHRGLSGIHNRQFLFNSIYSIYSM